MPERHAVAAPVRAFWSGTITFGLVSIPVDFYAGARARETSLRMVDAEGHPLGRRYTGAGTGRALGSDEIVRGYEAEDGTIVVITDAEFDSAAPEVSRDIDLSRFVPLAQIPPSTFVRPYFLAPTERAGKAYSLLAQTMERTGKVGIGRFVMRGHEYLVAIIAEGGLLRAETLRYFDELRSPETIGLPAKPKVATRLVSGFAREIARLAEKRLDLHELEDREAEALEELARRKLRARQDVVELGDAEEEEPAEGGAEVIDLVQLLRKSLGGQVEGQRPTRREPARREEAEQAQGGQALQDKTREELYQLASDLGIPGRSKMNKQELVRAIREH